MLRRRLKPCDKAENAMFVESVLYTMNSEEQRKRLQIKKGQVPVDINHELQEHSAIQGSKLRIPSVK